MIALLCTCLAGVAAQDHLATLGISEGTVKAYLTTLYEKVGARDRFELALFGLKNMGRNVDQTRGVGAAKSLRAVIPQRDLT